MNMIGQQNEMTQKSDREKAEHWNTNQWIKKQKQTKNRGWGADPTLEKKKGLPVPNIPGDELSKIRV